MSKNILFTSLVLASVSLFPLRAEALCASQWYEGTWFCKSPIRYDLRVEHDGASECSLSAVMQRKNGQPVHMDLIAANTSGFTVRDEGGATVRLRKYFDGTFVRGEFTIEGLADPIYCGRTPNVFVPQRGVRELGRIKDLTHLLSLRAYP